MWGVAAHLMVDALLLRLEILLDVLIWGDIILNAPFITEACDGAPRLVGAWMNAPDLATGQTRLDPRPPIVLKDIVFAILKSHLLCTNQSALYACCLQEKNRVS